MPGLDGEVEVLRDGFGVPNIYASTSHDLFFAQGVVHAQDRFFQMDFWRHIGSGRLAEMFGEDQLDNDLFLRTLRWRDIATDEYSALPGEDRAILDAYAEGVNAYLATRSPSELAFEYSILELTNHSYTPEPWSPIDTLTWLKVMAWDLRGNMDAEIDRAILLHDLDAELLDTLYPAYPGAHPTIVGDRSPAGAGPAIAPLPTTEAVAGASDLAAAVMAFADTIDDVTGGGRPGLGSNSWVVSGALTASGKPLLANDPHLSIQMPSIWYQVGLHCRPVGAGCPYAVAGFTFPGAPGVVIGHNDRVAWGFTNLGPDVMDLVVERLDPANPNRYEVDGEFHDMTITTETVEVAGGDSEELTIRWTRNGPIISDTFGRLEDFDTEAGIDLPADYAISLRWTALEPVPTFSALVAMNQASNWNEFRDAAAMFAVPSQNLVYADVDGNIGYQSPGNVPIRATGDGRLPVPGWDTSYDWTGFIPFDELPTVFNPPEGYIVTANNAVVGPGYPYLLTHDWSYGYRARRIVDMVESVGVFDVPTMSAMQFDTYNLNAGRLVPERARIGESIGSDPESVEFEALAALLGWDLRNDADSTGAAVFGAFWRELQAAVFHDDLPEDLWPQGGSRWFAAIDVMLDAPAHPLWDDAGTSGSEDRDTMLAMAFGAAVADLRDRLGGDVSSWAWGDLHTATFENQTLGQSGIGLIENRFNRGPYPTAGGESIVNAVGSDPTEGFEVDWLPSMRMVIDLSDLDASLAIHTTGQSGHPYHEHYQDMIPLWLEGANTHMAWSRGAVEMATTDRLVLLP
ncbi:MAG: penicillin acylase family protein [Acidimicrobiia bacterium]|nr:penicillin acylase family protein [Acidimicrobiia bacterium]